MKITTLIENTAPEGLSAEWGLSLHISFRGKRYLLDVGETDLFLKNAEALGIEIPAVDCGILSHAHHDHGGGLEPFFRANSEAPFYLRSGSRENAYKRYPFHRRKYIGLERGILERRRERILLTEGNFRIDEGVWLIPHSTQGLERLSRRASLYTLEDGRLRPDALRHEQSLVFETSQGLVICNSCSHGGADNIVREAVEALPGRAVLAVIGGFHLKDASPRYIRSVAKNLLGIPYIYTGHCTGMPAFVKMKEILGDSLRPLTTGTVIELED